MGKTEDSDTFFFGHFWFSSRFVDISKLRLHDHYMKQYADVLYRWNLLGKRAEVIKFLSEPQQPHSGVG